MKTILTDSPEEAAEFIRRGRLAAFPTETVYGLGADILNERAVAKIFEAKQRPSDNPLIMHIAELGQIELLASRVTKSSQILIDNFFPGPLTVVLEKSAMVPVIATAGLNTVGIRMPRNNVARAFLVACKTPVAAPSANISGRPSPTTWQAVVEDLDGRIDCILRGDPTEIGLESTVVDCTSDPPVLLRTGAISLRDLLRFVPETRTMDVDDTTIARSPGVRHHHYSPRAKVRLIDANEAIENTGLAAYIGIHERLEPFQLKKVCSSIEAYAHKLFEFFRECDREGIEQIFCEVVSTEGIGSALMDRLKRASGN